MENRFISHQRGYRRRHETMRHNSNHATDVGYDLKHALRIITAYWNHGLTMRLGKQQNID